MSPEQERRIRTAGRVSPARILATGCGRGLAVSPDMQKPPAVEIREPSPESGAMMQLAKAETAAREHVETTREPATITYTLGPGAGRVFDWHPGPPTDGDNVRGEVAWTDGGIGDGVARQVSITWRN